MTWRQVINDILHFRPPSVDEWRECPLCHNNGNKKCSFCGGEGTYFHYDDYHPTLAERLCPHRWVREKGYDDRFCKWCGRHEHRTKGEKWELIWNIKEQDPGLLPALVWWHEMGPAKRYTFHPHPLTLTYGEVKDLYEAHKHDPSRIKRWISGMDWSCKYCTDPTCQREVKR